MCGGKIQKPHICITSVTFIKKKKKKWHKKERSDSGHLTLIRSLGMTTVLLLLWILWISETLQLHTTTVAVPLACLHQLHSMLTPAPQHHFAFSIFFSLSNWVSWLHAKDGMNSRQWCYYRLAIAMSFFLVCRDKKCCRKALKTDNAE